MMNETELLRAFKEERSEEAFAQLVRRYAGLVYSAARRRMNDAALAEDITQLVFIRFAKSPPDVSTSAALVGWLHRTTLNVAVDTWRSETRRRTREQQASAMETVTNENNVWEEISPNLDEALNQLNDTDREAILLRFLSQKTMREVGVALGVSEDAAKMRVGRALDRLRTQLGVRATACTAVMLGGILAEKSAQAVPSQLVARLAALKLPALAKTASAGGALGGMLRSPGLKLAAAAVAVAVVGFATFRFSQSQSPPAAVAQTAGAEIKTVPKPSIIPRRQSAEPAMQTPPPSKPVKIWFHVRDAETGAGLAGAKIHFAYFGVGGIGESHDSVTDANGDAPVTEPDNPTRNGPNVFIVAEGHVPKVVAFPGAPPADYTINLPPAMTIGGTVVDEEDRPVGDVEIRVEGPGNVRGQIENVDFQTCPITNRADGSWTCSYIPREYTNSIWLNLKKAGYAPTIVLVQGPPRQDLSRLALVIERGFSISGRVTDEEKRPIAKADIAILSGQSNHRKSTATDDNGEFVLAGVSGETSSSHDPPFGTNAAGFSIIRSVVPIGTPEVKLAIKAEGFAPVVRTLTLSNAASNVELALAPGRVFRGHVTDETGNPISRAVVQTDWDNNGIRALPWTTRTDDNGYFEWNSAPDEPVLFWFEAEGYEWQRGVSLVADGSDHEIVLKRRGNP